MIPNDYYQTREKKNRFLKKTILQNSKDYSIFFHKNTSP